MIRARKQHSLWWSFGLSAAIVMVTLLIVAWLATERVHDFFIHHLQNELESRAITVDQAIQGMNIIDSDCKILSVSDPDIRVTIVDAVGTVLCDSAADAEVMDNHATRLEIGRALTGQRNSTSRFSVTLNTFMLYYAMPRHVSGRFAGVIRTAIPLDAIDRLLDELHQQFLVLVLVMMIFIAMGVFYTYHKVSHPMRQISEKAHDLAQGDFNVAIPDYDIREIAELGNALNHMVSQLNRFENLRKDFVANVSHELKTPVATIKGYAETLLDGSAHSPQDIDHFLRIIHKQNDRLADIVDDLLTLSRLESAPVDEILDLHEYDVCDLLRSSADNCQARAAAKGIAIKLNCATPLAFRFDYSLMTQAMVNLLDNAIKYSYPNTRITLSVEGGNGQLQIKVCDQGPGIPDKHIPRLFERFHRVDKSRSRRDGGTGLGLAIVKHILQVHHGRIEVVNNRDAGCCFIIDLDQVEHKT